MRTVKRSTLTAKADARFGEYIRKRDRRCVICGSTDNLQCSHFYGKKAHSTTRYDEGNAHAMCAACHFKHHQSDPEMYREYMHDAYGDAFMDKLRLKAFSSRKLRDDDLRDIITMYEDKIKRLEGMWL